jgi:uncharacterized protein DUF6788
MAKPIQELEVRRSSILSELGEIGDMRRGSITEVYRRCGKAVCCCKQPGHAGHGPYYAYTTKVKGKTVTIQLRSGPLLTKIEREVEAYRRFRALSDELIEVNEKICNARPLQTEELTAEGVKKTFVRSSRGKSPKR